MGNSSSRLSRRSSRQDIGKGSIISTGDSDRKKPIDIDSKSGIEDFMPREDSKFLGVGGSRGSHLRSSSQESLSKVQETGWSDPPPAYSEIYDPRKKNFDALR